MGLHNFLHTGNKALIIGQAGGLGFVAANMDVGAGCEGGDLANYIIQKLLRGLIIDAE